MRATKENYFNKKVQRVKMEEETKKGEKITRKKSLKNRSGGRNSKTGRTTEMLKKPMCSCVAQLN